MTSYKNENEIDRQTVIKRMADLLRSGATLLAETCPLCGSPLLRTPSGETICPIHGRILVAKTEEEVAEASVLGVLTELEKSITLILHRYINMIKRGEIGEDLSRAIIYWLDAIERIERIKNIVTAHKQGESHKHK